jgi:TolB protein
MIAFSFAQNLSFDDEGNLQGSQGPHQDIFVAIIGNNDLVNLTNSESVDILPRWLPDSRRIAFVSDRDGNNEIYIINIDGTGLIRLTNHPANDRLPQVP